jgi:hypothetical protein
MLTQGAHAIRHDPLMKDASAFCGVAGTGIRERVRKRVRYRTPRKPRSPVLKPPVPQESANGHWDETVSFEERIFWLSLFTCPTCRKVYKPAILWQSHCSAECQQLDPRNNRLVAAPPQPDPLAPPRLPWE